MKNNRLPESYKGRSFCDIVVSEGTIINQVIVSRIVSFVASIAPLSLVELKDISACVMGFSAAKDADKIDSAVYDLVKSVDAIAPDGYYFGCHPSDPHDPRYLGFWKKSDKGCSSTYVKEITRTLKPTRKVKPALICVCGDDLVFRVIRGNFVSFECTKCGHVFTTIERNQK